LSLGYELYLANDGVPKPMMYTYVFSYTKGSQLSRL